jgi:hypothetical protein
LEVSHIRHRLGIEFLAQQLRLPEMMLQKISRSPVEGDVPVVEM